MSIEHPTEEEFEDANARLEDAYFSGTPEDPNDRELVRNWIAPFRQKNAGVRPRRR